MCNCSRSSLALCREHRKDDRCHGQLKSLRPSALTHAASVTMLQLTTDVMVMESRDEQMGERNSDTLSV